MSNVTKLRPFKIPNEFRVNSEFIPSNKENNQKLAETDLAKSGLTIDDIDAIVLGDLALRADATAGYGIPYTNPDGTWATDEENNIRMFRTRLEYKPLINGPKYTQPSKEKLEQYQYTATMPYIPRMYHEQPKTETLAICEGEKKTLAVQKLTGTSAIGIGGCWSWLYQGETHPHIMEIVHRHKKVIIVPDGDVLRYDICKAYGTFANDLIAKLEGTGIDVEIMCPPDKIDDLLVKWGPEAEGNFHALPLISPISLVEDPALLVKRYNLAFKDGKEGQITVEQNHSNVTILLERHPAFGEIWLNQDTDQVMIGETAVEMGNTDMEITNHFQHNLQMPRVTPQMVQKCITHQAYKNKRSPFKTAIDETIWDGIPRLSSYLHRLWRLPDDEYHALVGTRWFVSAYARIAEPGCKVDWMLVSTGPQGIGKSWFPDLMFSGLTVPLYGASSDKDTMLMIHSGLCLVLEEMDGFTKKETSFWKALISTTVDKLRPPYGAGVLTYKRRSVIYGCTNEPAFLQADPSGYRRYVPISPSSKLDFDAFQEELPQLWAEAKHLYEQGEPYWQVPQMDQEAMQEYVANDPLEDKMFDFMDTFTAEASLYRVLDRHGTAYWQFKPAFIMENLGMNPNSPRNGVILKNLCVRLGGQLRANAIGQRGTRAWVFEEKELFKHLHPNDPGV